MYSFSVGEQVEYDGRWCTVIRITRTERITIERPDGKRISVKPERLYRSRFETHCPCCETSIATSELGFYTCPYCSVDLYIGWKPKTYSVVAELYNDFIWCEDCEEEIDASEWEAHVRWHDDNHDHKTFTDRLDDGFEMLNCGIENNKDTENKAYYD